MRVIAIGILALALVPRGAAAQTAAEHARILHDFEVSVADYTTRGSAPAPRIFTLPVAMVFRQMIAKTLVERDGVASISGVGTYPHPVVLEPFPSIWLRQFPRVLQDVLPPLPAPLEYRLIGYDLVVRDTDADIVVGVLRDAVGPALTVIR